jgi:hypothetical protein
MKYSKEEFFALAESLPNPISTFWVKEDYKAIEAMLKSGIISELFAESEFIRLSEELLEESKNNV